MKLMQVVFLVLLLSLISCNRKKYQRELVREFIVTAKENDWKKLRHLLRYSPQYRDTTSLIHYTGILSEYFHKYGVAEENKWMIKQDTIGVAYIRWIIVPIFEGYDSTNQLEYANLRLGFSVSNNHLPDSVLFLYEVDVRKRMTSKLQE